MSLVRTRVERGPAFRAAIADTGTIRVEEFRAWPGMTLSAHAHPAPHFSVVLAGAMSERTDRGARWLGPGEGRASPAGDRHDLRLGAAGLHCLIVHAMAPAVADTGFSADGRTYLDGSHLRDLGEALAGEVRHLDDVSPIAIEMLTAELAAVFARAASGRPTTAVPPWLTALRERLADDPGSPPTLEELANVAGVSRAHVARAFRDHFGCTVGDHLRAIRARRARELLLHTDVPLARVAYRAGYADQSHMTREARLWLGTTPGRLRSAARGLAS